MWHWLYNSSCMQAPFNGSVQLIYVRVKKDMAQNTTWSSGGHFFFLKTILPKVWLQFRSFRKKWVWIQIWILNTESTLPKRFTVISVYWLKFVTLAVSFRVFLDSDLNYSKTGSNTLIVFIGNQCNIYLANWMV